MNLRNIEEGVMFASGDDTEAFIHVSTKEVLCISPDFEIELPADLYENEDWIPLPSNYDLYLGKPLVMEFAEQYLPEKFEEVRRMFSRRGAYRNFRRLLDSEDKLDEWYKFEDEERKWAIKRWCRKSGIELEEESEPEAE